jgi:hypothetical protein
VDGLLSTTIIKISPALTAIGCNGSVSAGMLEDAGSAEAGAEVAQAVRKMRETSSTSKFAFMEDSFGFIFF